MLLLEVPLDPNLIPVSPPVSALHLSQDDVYSPTGPPMFNWSSPESEDSSRNPTVIDLPAVENMPDIPDFVSKKSLKGPAEDSKSVKSVKIKAKKSKSKQKPPSDFLDKSTSKLEKEIERRLARVPAAKAKTA